MTPSQRYYLKNKEKVKEAARKWQQNNPEALKKSRQRYNSQPHRQKAKKEYKERHLERWRPGGRYYKPTYPYSLARTIRLLNELKRSVE